MRRLILLAILLAASVTAAEAQDKSRPGKPPARTADLLKNPLSFYVARGEADACGPGCNEWIAAEGQFDRGSAARFRRFLTLHGSKKLPVFFDSGGGIVGEALEIGRLMRERSVTAGVAKTVPERCTDDGCSARQKSTRTIDAELRSVGASCNSACVYAMIGASERIVTPGSRLGVHASRSICIVRMNGQPVDPATRSSACKRLESEGTAELERYVRNMGISNTLLAIASQVPHKDVRYLTRNEIARLGIDRRGFQESRWTLRAGTTRPSIIKVVTEAKGANQTQFRTHVFQLDCQAFAGVAVTYLRPTDEGDTGNGVTIRLVAGDKSHAFPARNVVSRIDAVERDGWFDRRAVLVPATFVDAAMQAAGLEIEERTAAGDGQVVTRTLQLSTSGLQGAWVKARPQCGRSLNTPVPYTDGPFGQK